MTRTHEDILAGCLLGSAVGDAIGLPYEGMSARRVGRRLRGRLQQRFVLGRGMVSDDTDHTVFVAQSLLVSGGELVAFQRALARRLRWWLLCLPAGIGWGTLRGIAKLWLGLRGGVASAGNAPSMRSAIIGAAYPTQWERRRQLVQAATVVTHTDPRALAGATAVAEIAAWLASGYWTSRPTADALADVLQGAGRDPAWLATVEVLRAACRTSSPTSALTSQWGLERGVSGYVLHSVPFAIACWYEHWQDYPAMIEAAVRAGGDTDTVAAIAGALGGIQVGVGGIPAQWVARLCDWPHGTTRLRALASDLARGSPSAAAHFSPWLLPRGALFLALVLAHGLRRLLPPW
ncbi:ADP-ribosylglycohydrolase family protein [Tahibacter amnicola]|uniref:ADP-ribosylglycohydrolase family protein n=1 Tax=Tahibacter amnicola TaxID=2976241 RepID=A0ABY6BDG4_9GAMM|nr:ADP-ribosylglycohydrolase family protein [Tahibacter amnicola]UXI68058.1 ADP-ribosylglycohydrolase family protein [Tahibacter amnicola]